LQSAVCNEAWQTQLALSYDVLTAEEYENIQLDMDELTVARPLETNVRDDRSFTRH